MINSKVPTLSTMSDHWKKGRFSNQTWDSEIIVEVTTLDELIKTYGLPSYIKIDVDGIEHLIMRGSIKTLNNEKLKSILVEINENYSEQYTEILKIMEKFISLEEPSKHSTKIWILINTIAKNVSDSV